MDARNPDRHQVHLRRASPREGEEAADFELPVLSGGVFRLSDPLGAGGHVLLVFLRHLA